MKLINKLYLHNIVFIKLQENDKQVEFCNENLAPLYFNKKEMKELIRELQSIEKEMIN